MHDLRIITSPDAANHPEPDQGKQIAGTVDESSDKAGCCSSS